MGIDRAGAFALCELSVRALSFYNGQVTSDRVLAAAEASFSGAEAVEAPSLVLEASDFNLPAPAAGSRSQAILLLKAKIQAAGEGEFTLTPTIVADGAELALPPLRVAAFLPAWRPLIAEGGKPDVLRLIRVLRLNRPAVHSAVAILPGDGADTLDQARRLIERLAPPPDGGRTRVALDTHKHLSPSFRVPKSHAEFSLDGLTAAPAWPKLFDPGNDYQTVRIGLAPVGAPWPYAGFSVQTSLRSGSIREASNARAGCVDDVRRGLGDRRPEGARRSGIGLDVYRGGLPGFHARGGSVAGVAGRVRVDSRVRYV